MVLRSETLSPHRVTAGQQFILRRCGDAEMFQPSPAFAARRSRPKRRLVSGRAPLCTGSLTAAGVTMPKMGR